MATEPISNNNTNDVGTGLAGILDAALAKNPMDRVYSKPNSALCVYTVGCAALTVAHTQYQNAIITYTKENAIADVDAAIAELFNNYRYAEVPQLFQMHLTANCYNHTTAQLLANDSYAKTVAKAAQLRMDAIAKYAQIRQQENQSLAQMIAANKGTLTVGSVGAEQGGGGGGGLFGAILGSFF